MQEIYSPSEDSYLLEQEVKRFLKNQDKNIKILDMGSGSGIQAKACIKSGIKNTNVLTADINSLAVKELKKQKLKSIQTNLFSKIKNKFNLIIFNAPYLPEHKKDKAWDTTAGKKGYEIIVKFLKQAKKHLQKNGTILLLFSNLSKPNIIKKHAKSLGYRYKKLNQKNAGFFEKLYVYKFQKI